jgi:glycerophosphoryl diester phosphodiesterase
VPVSTITLTASSASTAAIVERSAKSNSPFKAFLRSGRFNVTVAMPSATSVRITLMAADATVHPVANPWLDRRVLNYAHQGGAREGPSSTMAAMRRAIDAGAEALELDVHMTRDGVLVVCHDATVDRTTEGKGAIADLTFDELQQLDNAYWFVPGSVADHDPKTPVEAYVHRGKAATDPDFRIPRVADVLDEFPGVFLNFDVKQTAPVVPAYELALVGEVRKHGRVDDVIIASFNDASTDLVNREAPEIATSYGTAATADFYRAVRAGEPPPVTPHVALQVPRTFGEIVVVDGPFVDVWTIDDQAEMALLVELGVDGVMTDRPRALEAVLRQRGI